MADLVRRLLNARPPRQAEVPLAAATGIWCRGLVARLDDHRVAVWQYLDDKNGNSTTVADYEDHFLRALICVLWDDPWAKRSDELPDTVEWFEHYFRGCDAGAISEWSLARKCRNPHVA